MPAVDHSALQQAVFEALVSDTPLLAVLPDGAVGVSAFARVGQNFPYVVIEVVSSQPVPVKGAILDECAVTCAVYSQQAGGGEARQVMALLAQALQTSLDVVGYSVVLQQERSAQVQLMSDGVTYRGEHVLRVVTEQTGA